MFLWLYLTELNAVSISETPTVSKQMKASPSSATRVPNKALETSPRVLSSLVLGTPEGFSKGWSQETWHEGFASLGDNKCPKLLKPGVQETAFFPGYFSSQRNQCPQFEEI